MMLIRFQFLLVRLKERPAKTFIDQVSKFQFLLVRLKGSEADVELEQIA